jgi:hypothetical protein
MPIRITCIKRAPGEHENPYVAITRFGFVEDGFKEAETVSRESMHEFIVNGGKAYVKNSKGARAFLVAETTPDGAKFVKTLPDDINFKADFLLTLKECQQEEYERK